MDLRLNDVRYARRQRQVITKMNFSVSLVDLSHTVTSSRYAVII